jgi:hypothetical protein
MDSIINEEGEVVIEAAETEQDSDKKERSSETFLTASCTVDICEEPGSEKSRYSLVRDDIDEAAKRNTDYLILGFDTEYQSLKDEFTNEEVQQGLGKYEVLSYQFYAINAKGGEWGAIAIPDEGRRLSFAQSIVYALAKGVQGGAVRQVPKSIVLVGHYNRADLPAFDDRDQLFWRLNNVRQSLTNRGAPIKVRVQFSEDENDYSTINIYVRDTINLSAANRRSLAQIAPLVGLKKLKLSDDDEIDRELKQSMKVVRSDDWELFREYAMIDAEICARYYKRIADTVATLTGDFAPTVLPSIGMKLLMQEWEARPASIDAVEVIGRERVEERVYDDKRHYFRTEKSTPFVQDLHWWIDFATECYHGGRNEQLWFGPTPVGSYSDFDLAGAYPTAMAMIGRPRWAEAQAVRSLDEIEPNDLALVCVEFEFGADTRYPTLPVRSPNGLIFPLKGRSCCAMPEIELARQHGCKLRLRHGVRIPQDMNERIFAPFIKDAIAKRFVARAVKNDFDEAFWKEAANSVYGKTAQGLRDKRVLNLRSRRGERIPPSPITNPFIAAQITSMVRAVIGEIMSRVPAHRMVFSVTTDGFITDATAEEMVAARSGPLAKNFGRTRVELTGEDDTLTEKHAVRQLIGWRTRGQATLQVGESKIVLARAGIKPPIWSTEVEEQNNYILEAFFDRTPDRKIPLQVHTSLRDTLLWNADLVSKKIERRTSMEFDFKRKPHAVAMVSGRAMSINRDFDHIAFSTAPWESIDEFYKLRRYWDDYWGSTSPRCIKTLSDFRDFAGYFDMLASLDPKDAPWLRKGKNADLKRLQRDLCRAFKQGRAGLHPYGSMSAAQFAAVLDECGMKERGVVTTRATVENGKRAGSTFKPHTTPRTAAALHVLRRLQERMPTLEAATILSEPMAGFELSDALTASCPIIDQLRAARSAEDNFEDEAEEPRGSVDLY